MISTFTLMLRNLANFARCLSLVLLPVLVSEAHALTVPQRPNRPNARSATLMIAARPPLPYLAAIGPSPLRFAEAAARRAESPPPSPIPFVEPTPPAPTPAPVETPKPVIAEPSPTPAPAPVEAPPPAPATKPLNILPDDTRREIRPEDVLPFFQYPGAAGDPAVNVVVPFTPAQPPAPSLPPSSATYQLK